MRISRQRYRPLNTTARLLGKPPRCPEYNPGLYTVSELDQMILVDGYIPVANATEFDKIRTGNAETMGAGTCWEGEYTTGGDKKYIQINNIDFVGVVGWESIIPGGNFVYDGNELMLSNLTNTAVSNCGLFNSPSAYQLKNMRVYNFVLDKTSAGTNVAAISDQMTGGIIDNCIAYNCSITAGGNASGILGIGNNVTVTNSHCFNTVITGGRGSGIGRTANSTVTNCSMNDACTINTGGGGAGIIAGSGNLITHCYFDDSTIYSTGIGCSFIAMGGLEANNTVQDCVASSAVMNAAGNRINGIAECSGGSVIERCKVINCTINVSGSRTRIGGISGNFWAVGNIAECEVINLTINAPACNDVGGILGYDQQPGEFINCRVIGGSITGNSNVGGCAGRKASGVSVYANSFSTAEVIGNSNVGGFSGSGVSSNVNSCYWDTDASGNPTSAAGIGKTTSELQTPTSNTGIYANWDPNVWDFGTSSEYPKLINTP